MLNAVLLGPDFLTETKTWAAACTVRPPTQRMSDVDKLIRALKASSLWASFDALYLLAAHDEQAGRLNLVAPGTFTLTATNSPTFTTDRGFASDGSTSYLTGPNNNALTKYVQDSGHIAAWMSAANTSTRSIGTASGTGTSRRTAINPVNASSKFIGRVNSTANVTSLNNTPNPTGLLAVNRADNANVSIYNDGSFLETLATASAAPNAIAIDLLREATTQYSPAGQNIKCASFGASLAAAQQLALYQATSAYMTAVGA